VIDQRAGRPSASRLGPNECFALQDTHAHGRQSAFSFMVIFISPQSGSKKSYIQQNTIQ